MVDFEKLMKELAKLGSMSNQSEPEVDEEPNPGRYSVTFRTPSGETFFYDNVLQVYSSNSAVELILSTKTKVFYSLYNLERWTIDER